jgi:acetyl esterase/lipase
VVQLSTGAAHRRDAQQPDPCCSPDYIQRVVKAYAGNTPLSDPRLDHLAADMRGWPPILLQVGGTECLVADAELFGAAMRAAGARCEVQVWPGQVHVFGFPSTVGPRKVPEVRAALDYGSRFLLDR